MKKNTLIQLVLIYAGIDSFLSGLFFFIPRLMHLFFNTPTTAASTLPAGDYMITEIVRMILGLLLLFKSGGISNYLAERTGGDNSISINTKPPQLIYILIIIVALAHIIQHLPFLLFNIALMFSSASANKKGTSGLDYTAEQWLLNFCHLVVPFLFIVFSRRISDYFGNKSGESDEEIVVKHDSIFLEASGDKFEEQEL